MLKHVDSALENDKMAGIGAGLLGIGTWVCLGLSLIPEAHIETAGSMATMAVFFAAAALRRNSNAATRQEVPSEPVG